MTTSKLPERLRSVCEQLRRTPMALADLIPTLQEAADALDAQRAAQQAYGNIDAAAPSFVSLLKLVEGCVMLTDKQIDGQVSELMRLVDVLSDSAAESEVSLQVGSRMQNKHIKEHLLARAAVEAFARTLVGFGKAQPVQQQLVPLTDKQIYDLWPSECMAFCEEAAEFARAIEAHHGIKPAGEENAA